MAPHADLTFDCATELTGIHDTVQAQAGLVTWVRSFHLLSRVRVNTL